MKPIQYLALALIIGGVAALFLDGFSFTKDTHQARLGPMEFSVEEKQTVNLPLWASVIAITAGAGLLVVGIKKT